ncbi:MAG TPA: YihY/virulence factor BrkB family protein [Nitrospira sp.]|nr:YihY/virulence factor BrkB family protein [Nitrospira sp.]
MSPTSAEASLTSRSPAHNPWKLGGLSIWELSKRLWHETLKDDLLARAAQLSYYILLALFPALIFLTSLMGVFSVGEFMPQLMGYAKNVLPEDALSMVERFLTQVAQGAGTNILSLGVLAALWWSSSGVVAVMEGLNVVYDVKEDSRPFWKVRLVGIALTLALAGFVLLSLALVLYGPGIGAWIAGFVGLGPLFVFAWNVLQWPVVVALMLFVMGVLYYVCPDIEQDWRWVSPGSAFAVLMWLIMSLGFKMYVDNFGDYNKVYGSIAGVIVLMLWLYWSGMVLLLGGEINAEIEKAATARDQRSQEPKAA